MKNFFCYLALSVFMVQLGYSQVLKVGNGLSISSIKSKNAVVLSEGIYSYSCNLGVDYLDRKYFYLSSEIAYLGKGGKENSAYNVPDEDGKPVFKLYDKWEFLQLNTTIRFRYPFNGYHVFAGIGPKVDFLLGDKGFRDWIFSQAGYEVNSVNIGARCEIGVMLDLNKRIKAGLNLSYLWNFEDFGSNGIDKLSNNTYLLLVTIGYRL